MDPPPRCACLDPRGAGRTRNDARCRYSSRRSAIERLIDAVAKATDRRFIRNGTEYDASTAARFLRAKWSYARNRIHTAEDFVHEIGTRSSTTGTRYRVRSPDGQEEDGASFLLRALSSPADPAAPH